MFIDAAEDCAPMMFARMGFVRLKAMPNRAWKKNAARPRVPADDSGSWRDIDEQSRP
jgi:hypothetical protein